MMPELHRLLRHSVRRTLTGWMVSLLLLNSLSACSWLSWRPAPTPTPRPRPTQPPTPTHTATLTPTPTATFTPTPTSTPTSTPTPLLLAYEGTPLPAELPTLVPENAPWASALAEWRLPALTDFAWLPDSQILAASEPNGIHFFDLQTRRHLRSLYPQVGGIIDLAISPDGTWLVTGSRQGSEAEGYVSSLELWLGPNWRPMGVLYNAPRGLASMSFSAEGRHFVAAFASPILERNSVEIWNTLTWVITDSLKTGPVLNIAFAPHGGLLALSPDRYAIRVWGFEGQEWLYRFPTSFTGAVTQLAFSPDGLSLASAHYDGWLRLWDLRSGELIWEAQAAEVLQCLAFSPDGSLIATGGAFQNSLVRLWDASTGELLRTLEGHVNGVERLAFAPHGQLLVSGSYDGTLRVWGIRP